MWDGDGDRAVFCDETGRFITGYFMTAILAAELLRGSPGEKIIIDPRLTWATTETIRTHGGIPLINRAGMTLIAARMREENARFAGELSSHFYFRESFNRDNSLIPLLLILSLMAKEKRPLSAIVQPFFDRYFISEEINSRVPSDAMPHILKTVRRHFGDGEIDHIDGLSVARPSNTEPLLRLNVESLVPGLMEEKRDEILAFIRGGTA
jgi:phosphomannomutase